MQKVVFIIILITGLVCIESFWLNMTINSTNSNSLIFLDLKQKILEHRENSEQIENLQCQELSKVKQLVLEKDRELSDKNAALKDANNQLEKLRTELNRLRRQEETLSDVQVCGVVFFSV